ncbi:hypothetical protein CLOP_g18508 [Closterium sp. NIES-67]|nr:hypothetical protein CLOP_g18017 [Closterium sp. NIES-67]GJP61337.1 hypothetical protein CLOP_g18508 [Closterium sp. NIES-67]
MASLGIAAAMAVASAVPPLSASAALTRKSDKPSIRSQCIVAPRQRASVNAPSATSSPVVPHQPVQQPQQSSSASPPSSPSPSIPSCHHHNPQQPSLQHHTDTQRHSLTSMAACAAAVLSATLLLQQPALAQDSAPPSPTEAVFARTCAGCHAGGGNLLKPGAGLSLADLERNGLSSVEDIARVTALSVGRMPGYGEDCKPRGQCTFGPRLSADVIRQLAEYTLAQAQAGWP